MKCLISFISSLLLLVLMYCSLAPDVLSQGKAGKYTISGYVRDSASGEELIGATVLLKENRNLGTTSNAYGFYSITVDPGDYTVMVQYIGFKTIFSPVKLQKNIKIDFKLQGDIYQLSEVKIESQQKDENITKIKMGDERIDIREIDNIPVLLGEKDVLKTIQLKPGVKPVGEGSSGYYVRGGAADQNLILLDEATVFNASHLLGFFSVFNSDALKDVTFYKGTQPAEFGGRLSSVLDIRMQEGNDQKFGLQGGIGLISSRLKAEGPITKDKGSFSISARRTYADVFLKLSKDTTAQNATLYFYDLNAKANYRLNSRNRIYLSGYFGKDVLGFKDAFGFDWGNATGTFRWNSVINERLFSNASLIFSNYDYNIKIDVRGIKGKIISRIQDYNIKQDFQYFPDTKNKIKFGFNSIYHRIIPGAITVDNYSSISELQLENNYDLENAVYFSHEFKPGPRLGVEYGIRLTFFSVLGPGDFYTYNSLGETTDTTSFLRGEIVKTYFNPEPRLTLNYLINGKNSIKASYTRNVQNLHLISNSTSGNPTDLWIPSSLNVKPETADHFALGYFRNFFENSYEFSTEVYYKSLGNQIDYKDGAELNFNQKVESQLLFGSGRAYGIEFLLKKKYGKINGWIGYTIARTEKAIEGINQGKYYPSKQDRLHDFSLVAIYNISPKWTVSGTWIYYTGNAVTFPSGKYEMGDKVINYYTERNGYRMPAYHRLDLGATWYRKRTQKYESSWNFSLYNAYGRENAYTITFKQDPNDPTKTQAVQTTLFRWVPSITYNFKF
jgi:hypothetical protein